MLEAAEAVGAAEEAEEVGVVKPITEMAGFSSPPSADVASPEAGLSPAAPVGSGAAADDEAPASVAVESASVAEAEGSSAAAALVGVASLEELGSAPALVGVASPEEVGSSAAALVGVASPEVGSVAGAEVAEAGTVWMLSVASAVGVPVAKAEAAELDEALADADADTAARGIVVVVEYVNVVPGPMGIAGRLGRAIWIAMVVAGDAVPAASMEAYPAASAGVS